ncbi:MULTISPECIES: ATP-dependent zinc metalloprotease FtsH [Pseudonocardia]|uniref:ATP-dependent zinc metalloprotease FtsH n=2 Tax=Pseudonocardia TaxID=1847 RepID=A0A1Y2MX88_PSEAH|nr:MULTISPECIES: ATP-dependent zinc metalloprotease FtsH [Pseudonocardia]OSY39810.1 ATP-dependent zinc metalloprotease FtsH [Pseudonocardia autotrophica]TDN74406.1 membrane protease FtsH catalytic subunit [Pseudonocardia autotrophica]BBG05173.1 ATP-dependent zinc metalloprotease FtsH [Pseudonocardia autotrophica]GEC28108.1 ATP-dependent zinc metalloprotease FtsH [Pseudonocardia saturnea]
MDRKRLLRNPLIWILVALLIYLGFSFMFDDTRGYTDVPTSVALAQIQEGNVRDALVEDREQQLRLTLNTPYDGETQIMTQYPAQLSGQIFDSLRGVPGIGEYDTVVRQDSFLSSLLIMMIPLALVLIILFWFLNNAQGGGNRVMSFGKSKAKQLNKDMPKNTFADVAGSDEAVEELHEIKDFLQNPARYQALGAKIPKGVLLYGPPGTGKTLLARAVAGEAAVPFYTISGSDFVEMFVGVGASRVRDLFEQAKQNAPCIIFVDEIDAVGRQRGAGLGGGHDEREQTLNQLLVEMDGFDARGGIILIAATNRPDILDPALLRPGRFDRQIPVGAPDLAGRRAILNVHSKGKPFADDVDFESLAKRTVGMSGADLANVINEAALLTAREHGTLINGAALEESVDRVVGGPKRKSKIVSERERKITAYHEGGHALAAWAMPDLEPVYKLTILPRGRTGGHALVVPEDDKGLMTRAEMIARLVFAMGGRSAEELVFHEPTTGASSDIDQATKIARAMVTEYGMSAKLGAVRYGREQGDPFLGRSMGNQADYSLEIAHEIDEEVRKLIEAAHTEAWEILNTYRDVLDDLVLELLERETLNRRDLERIFGSVEKRPRITAFDDFGERTPSEKPPIKTPRELAHERGEVLPDEHPRTPAQVGAGAAGNGYGYGDAPGMPGASPFPAGGSTRARPDAPDDGGYGTGNGHGAHGGTPDGGAHNGEAPNGAPHNGGAQAGNGWGGAPSGPPQNGYQGGYPQPRPAVAPNYGAPPDWRPATTPRGQTWPPSNWSGAEQNPQQRNPQQYPAQQQYPPGQHPQQGQGDDPQQGGPSRNGPWTGAAGNGATEPGENRRGTDPEAGH